MARALLSLLRDRSGAAAAELVLVMPILFALIFTTLEGAHYLYIEHQVVKGVRDGARFAARFRFSEYTCAAVSANLATSIKEVTRTGVTNGGAPRVAGWDNDEITVSVDCAGLDTGIYKGMVNAPRVTVTATVPYPSLFNQLSGVALSVNVFARQQSAVMGV